ncbi:MAG: hypothetical protein ACJ79M_07915, partial [Myxococcales bacterium]
GFALDHAAMMRAALSLFEATARAAYLDDAQRWRDVLLRDFIVSETGILAMTAKDGERLLVRPQPTHDDAVPNANGVFAEALVRLAQVTGAEDDRALAESALTTLAGIARIEPVAHASVLNALDLYLRGLTIVISGGQSGRLREAALSLPYLERSVCALTGSRTLDENHPARSAVLQGEGAQALICSGMRCSLPVTNPAALLHRARDMLAGLGTNDEMKSAGHRPGQ